MSYANLLGVNGKISSQYLPTPSIQNPFTSPVDGGNQPITNLAGLQIGATGPIPAGLGLNMPQGNIQCLGKIAVAGDKWIQDDGIDNFLIHNEMGQLNFQGPAGLGQVFDSVNNPPPPRDTTIVQQVVGTIATVNVPATTSTGLGASTTIIELSLADAPPGTVRNNFVVYLKLNTGTLGTPDATAYTLQYFLSSSLDGDPDETQGCTIGYTDPITNGGNQFIPITVLVHRPTIPVGSIFLNIRSLPVAEGGAAHSGLILSNVSLTADVYASSI